MRTTLIAVPLILLGITAIAGYYSVIKNDTWIFGDSYVNAEYITQIKITPEELNRFPTVKAYLEYLTTEGRIPANSWSIDFWEAKSFLSLLEQKSTDLGAWKFEGYEVWSCPIEVNGNYFGINIAFGERPVLD